MTCCCRARCCWVTPQSCLCNTFGLRAHDAANPQFQCLPPIPNPVIGSPQRCSACTLSATPPPPAPQNPQSPPADRQFAVCSHGHHNPVPKPVVHQYLTQRPHHRTRDNTAGSPGSVTSVRNKTVAPSLCASICSKGGGGGVRATPHPFLRQQAWRENTVERSTSVWFSQWRKVNGSLPEL